MRLQTYKENIDRIEMTLNGFDNLANLQSSVKITKLKLKELSNRYESLAPKVRSKRGLINGLGTIIKTITGNMDANDAQTLNKEIEGLTSNQQEFEIKLVAQSKINSEMIKRFETITDHINNETSIIKNYLDNYQRNIGNEIQMNKDLLVHSQYLNQINFNIDLLTSHLTNIAEAIVLARLNIVPKQILNHEEINEIYYTMNNQSIEMISEEHIYEILGLQAYYNNTNIIFNIQIPIISLESYSHFHIIPIPINGTKIIETKPYIILNPKSIQYLDKRCPKIENIYYCQESLQQEKIEESSCIGRIMNNKRANCILRENGETHSVTQPEPNFILFVNAPRTHTRSTCGNNNQFLNGTLLIHFKSCEVEINGIRYQDNPHIFWDEVHVHPATLMGIETNKTIETLNLNKLKQFQFENREAMEILRIRTDRRDNYTWTALVFCLIFLILGAYLFHKRTVICQRKQANNHIETPTTGSTDRKLLWSSLHSNGVGVTMHP